MRGVNKVIIVGTLRRDVELRFTPNGNAVATLSLATSEEWKDKNTGEKQTKTEWHRATCFGKLAEVCGKYLAKGSQIYIEGKLTTRKYQDQSGQDRYSTEINFDEMQMLGGKKEGQQGGYQDDYQGGNQRQSNQRQGNQGGSNHHHQPDLDDDIPF